MSTIKKTPPSTAAGVASFRGPVPAGSPPPQTPAQAIEAEAQARLALRKTDLAGAVARHDSRAILTDEELVQKARGFVAEAHKLADSWQKSFAKLAHDQNGLAWAEGQHDVGLVNREQGWVDGDEGAMTAIDRTIADHMVKNRPDPVSALTWKADPKTSELFAAGGPKAADVHQGNNGDCYFMAALSAAAAQDPSLLQRNVWQVGPTTYHVTLYQNGRPVTVSVGLNDLRSNAAQDPTTKKAILWPLIYETAYAKVSETGPTDNLGWSHIGRSGSLTQGLDALTGGTSRESLSASATAAALSTSLAEGAIVTCQADVDVAGTGVVGPHIYAVTGVDGQGNITVRNPWGQWPRKPTANSGIVVNADGSATMSFATWQKLFQGVATSPKAV